MNCQNLTRSAVLLTACAGLASCISFSKSGDSLHDVDDLLGQIEHVHVESERAKETLSAAVGALHTLVSPSFQGDPAEAYAALVVAIERSEEQAENLRSAVEPMHDMGKQVFEQWSEDLNAFNSPEMRARSRNRLEETRDRYEVLVRALEPAQTDFESFNLLLRDHALYLGHDFNASSVAEIEDDVRTLTRRAAELDERFSECLTAAETYVRAAALRGQIPVSKTEQAERSGS